MNVKIAHIVNPYSTPDFRIQKITYDSMCVAKAQSSITKDITLYATQYESDHISLDNEFISLPYLTRSVCDVNPNLKGRRLPLIADIFQALKECDYDYLIYTNTDIALMPFFYDAVMVHISDGHDAVVVNRRRLSKKYEHETNLSLMYADIGRSHPGFDCFVLKRELLDKFILDEICVGIPFLEVTLLHNIAAYAKKPLYIPDAHLTFHIGLDVMPKRDKLYYWHNRNTYFKKIYPQLKPLLSIRNFPYAHLSWHKKMIKWMLNPSLFTRQFFRLEISGFWNKLNEVRWRILQR